MADFARVLAALDTGCPELTGGQALALYIGQRSRIAEDVIDNDPLAVAIVSLVDRLGGAWSGTAGDLLQASMPQNPSKDWPRNGRGMVGLLKRITPALRLVGIEISKPAARTSRGQTYMLERVRVGASKIKS